MRIVMAILVVVAIALLGGGQLLESQARHATAEAFAASFHDVREVDVELSGFPLLYHVARGKLPALNVEARDVVVDDPRVTLSVLEVRLRDVSFDRRVVLERRIPALHVRRGTFTAVLAESELARLVAAERPGWQVELDAGSVSARRTVAGVTISIKADVRLADGAVELKSRRVEVGALGRAAGRQVARAFDLRVPLPDLPEGLRLEEVRVEPDALVLAGSVPAEVRLRTRPRLYTVVTV